MANSTLEPAGSATPPPRSKPSLAQAFRTIFSKSEDTDEGKVIARRRKFVMAAVLGTLERQSADVSALLSIRARYTNRRRSSASGIRRTSASAWTRNFKINTASGWCATPRAIFVISAICTHLGCTPDWKPSENKFKCPCHGSGYDPEGINFEGPGAASHGPGACGTRPGGTDCGGSEPRLPLAQGRAEPIWRPGRDSPGLRTDHA